MNATIPILTTPRLILRPLELSDADAVQEIFPQWEIVRYLASRVPWPYPADGALRYLRDQALPAMEQGKEWHWSIRLKNVPDRLIGVISLMDAPGDNRGFWLDPAWQERGLMAEACIAATNFWFEHLERPVLRAPKATANVRARRISEQSGMRLIEKTERDYVSGRLPAEIWEITRTEWRKRCHRTRMEENGIMTAHGSCLCGKIAYEVDLPFEHFYFCHCSRCRKATGGAHAANGFVKPEAFRWTRGETEIQRYDMPEAKRFGLQFCRHCGARVPHHTRDGARMVVPAGSLDDDPGATVQAALHWASRAPWYPDPEDLHAVPRYDAAPG